MHQIIRHTFNANDDNAIGRFVIKNQVKHHYEAIISMHSDLEKIKQYKNVYPVLEETKKKQQIQHPVRKKQKKKIEKLNYPILSKTTLKQQDEFRMIYNTFKAINSLKKGEVDQKCPSTMEFKTKLLNKPKWENEQKFINEQHESHIQNQFGRVKSAQNLPKDVRKKNECDPIAYPTYHFEKAKKKEFLDKNGVHFSELHKQHKSKNEGPHLKNTNN